MAEADQPNILFILTDDQRYDELGFLNPVLETPSMDALGKQVAQQGYITDGLTDYLVDFLETPDPNKPFFAYLSHKAVHAMFEPAERHRTQYSDADIKLGKPPAPDADVPLWVLNQRNSWHGSEFPYYSELPLKEFKRQYHRTLTAVDDSVGRVRQWLKDNGLAESTVVMLMGDNGFMFGEHGATR